jgi:hypothetical protein
MVPGRKLGHHASKHPMQVDLAEKLVREQASLTVQDRYGTFVAGGFDGQDTHRGRGDVSLRLGGYWGRSSGSDAAAFAFCRMAQLESPARKTVAAACGPGL